MDAVARLTSEAVGSERCGLPADWLSIQRQAARSGSDPLHALARETGLTVTRCLDLVCERLALSRRVQAGLEDAHPEVSRVPFELMRRRRVLLVRQADELVAIVADPFDWLARDWITGLVHPDPVRFEVCDAEALQDLLHEAEAGNSIRDTFATHVAADQSVEDDEIGLVDIHAPASGQAVVLLNSILMDALQAGASDVHLETGATRLEVKLRIDGVLADAAQVPGRRIAEQLISRIKVLSQLDIAERRRPQDGRFRVRDRLRAIDLRVSIMPSIHGEDAVLRILDKSRLTENGSPLTLQALGFDAPDCDQLRRLVGLPYGMLLVTGPTGSGKSTTLYAALSEMRSGRDKIVTIEDPVEYELPGVLQIPVNERKGLTFAVGLRSILRHDPDRIMVGEIRDAETADIAIQAALTGHLVLTTVHANNVFDVIGRLENMRADPYTIAASVNGIWAQRLLRRLCDQCARPAACPAIANTLVPQGGASTAAWREAVGCAACRHTGYRGRIAVAEVLEIDDGIRELIANRASATRIKERALAAGTRLLRTAALHAAARGVTSVDEVLRVTRHD
jgi:general secretion pathway protein E